MNRRTVLKLTVAAPLVALTTFDSKAAANASDTDLPFPEEQQIYWKVGGDVPVIVYEAVFRQSADSELCLYDDEAIVDVGTTYELFEEAWEIEPRPWPETSKRVRRVSQSESRGKYVVANQSEPGVTWSFISLEVGKFSVFLKPLA